MYFVGLTRLKDIPKPLLHEFDAFLKKYYASMYHFTPLTMARELHISEETAWELLFAVRNTGLIRDVFVQQCGHCQTIQRKKDGAIDPCRKCGEMEQIKTGYYWQVFG